MRLTAQNKNKSQTGETMKNLFKRVVLFASTLFLVSCATPDNTGAENAVVMTAKIDNIFDRIEVSVLESEYAFGVHWVITSSETEFVSKDGKKITREDLEIGDTVEIVYNGQVMMSYPPQIVARKITVK